MSYHMFGVPRGVRRETLRETYQTYTTTNCRGQRVENVHSGFEPLCELVIASP